MHNVLIIFYIAFSIGNLFILPELYFRTGLLYFPGGSPVSQAPPSGCVRFGGMEPGPLQDAMRGAVIRFGLGSDVPDTGLLLRPGAQCPDGFGHVTLFFKGFSSP